MSDCPQARSTWSELVPRRHQAHFFSLTWNDWLEQNLCRLPGVYIWQSSLATNLCCRGCWTIWNCRNQRIHEPSAPHKSKQGARVLNLIAQYNREHHLVTQIRQMLKRDWQIVVKHIYREGNLCADCLASLSINLAGDRVTWIQPPPEALQLLKADLAGHSMPRHVLV